MEQSEHDDQGIVVPRYPDSVRVPPDDEASQAQIEAGWLVFDAEGLDCPPVETMQALWAAMWNAR